MHSVTRTYRIATSLSIAYARLSDILAPVTVQVRPAGTVTLGRKAELDRERERAFAQLEVESALLTIGGWRVTVDKVSSRWQRGELMVTCRADGIIALGGTEAQQLEAMRDVERLEGDLREALIKLEFDEPQLLRFDLVAVTPTETLVSALCIGGLLRPALESAEANMQALWGKLTPAQPLPLLPVEPTDPRLAEFEPHQRAWICAVNRGQRLVDVIERHELSAAETFISRLRKRRLDIVRPASPVRQAQGRKSGQARRAKRS